MKARKLVMMILAGLFLILGGGLLWVAEARLMPTTQTVQQAIPDDHISR